MIKVNVRTNDIRKSVTAEITDTPATVFNSVGVDYNGSSVSVDGKTCTYGELEHKTFAELSVVDGSEIVIRATVKADGAAA